MKHEEINIFVIFDQQKSRKRIKCFEGKLCQKVEEEPKGMLITKAHVKREN